MRFGIDFDVRREVINVGCVRVGGKGNVVRCHAR